MKVVGLLGMSGEIHQFPGAPLSLPFDIKLPIKISAVRARAAHAIAQIENPSRTPGNHHSRIKRRWRPGAESNRCRRICNPLDSHSPTGPYAPCVPRTPCGEPALTGWYYKMAECKTPFMSEFAWAASKSAFIPQAALNSRKRPSIDHILNRRFVVNALWIPKSLGHNAHSHARG